ncbi:hypothetical protein, partial [Tenuifilum sp.]|uniref:hypothetical protein n=1 Tax=Tenuifilum sp. TaxID=2760880 RepID=UPI002BF14E7D|nr:hypothetical protein [Tenuifilum sp.]HQE53844.1 hypothetical protein [Tenuifilum sp.]HQG71815.1 hypothetical protein [Tenuifilum sp.]HQI88416.1 hypothetical protein [Tenuifilum sp.]HRR10827.1 hypothetical protein [Tenuifilum sp.]
SKALGCPIRPEEPAARIMAEKFSFIRLYSNILCQIAIKCYTKLICLAIFYRFVGNIRIYER